MQHTLSTALTPIATLTALLGMPTVAAGQDGYSLSAYRLATDSATEWKLPRRLKEISGLAASPDGRLFAHDDERAVIYEIDFREEKILKAFALGDDVPVTGDFEGIALVDDRFFLVTSDGWLFESQEGADGEILLYNTFRTPVGAECEVEGLAFEPSDRSLLLACKTPRIDDLKKTVAIFRWSVDRREMAGEPILIPRRELTASIHGKAFRPSGIERHPITGNYFVVAARQAALAEVTPRGEVVAVRELPADAHRQAEGITFLPDNSLVTADEGSGRRARVTVYRPPQH